MGTRVFDYGPGNVLVMFYPLAVEVEYVEASPAVPFLAAGVRIDLGRMADVLLRIERAEHAQPDQDPHRVSQSQLQLVGARARSEAIAAEHDDRLRWDVTAMVGIPTD